MEENRRFSWSGLFIKIILVVIFILFVVWLLSLSNKGLSNSLGVLTDNIFSQNMEKMKEVGKEYFTTERLPKKIGEVETLTLEEMYEKKLILELVDKYGNVCDAEDSYVSIEKLENEYQMKVNLECGDEEEYIIVIMGCYDYCDTDICEKKEEIENSKKIEYQYSKTTGGSWTNYGNWSEWSKIAVTNTDYRQVETKKVNEEYTYDKDVTEVVYAELEASCPKGYEKTSDGSKCYKVVASTETSNPVCSSLTGYTLTGRDGFTCKYSKSGTQTTTKTAVCPTGYDKSGNTCVKSTTETANPTCPSLSGYQNTGRDGFTCSYSKSTTTTANPVCPSVSGYTNTGRNGFVCSYSKTSSETTNPTCPSVSGYTMTGRNGFTCNYTKYVKGDYVGTNKGEYVPGNTTSYIYEEVGSAEYVYDCNNSCAFRWIHTWKIYKAVISSTTRIASCPSGYSQSGNTCAKGTTSTLSRTASCPTGYSTSGSTCAKTTSSTTTNTASCPTGYSKSGNTCAKVTTLTADLMCPILSGYTYKGRNESVCNYSRGTTETTTKTASCPTGYSKSGNTCTKTVSKNTYKDLILSCPTGYNEDGVKCSKEVESTIKVTGTKEVTYYRYRVREYKGGTTDYKWSTSNNDKDLLNAGYRLTGKTR